jgi:hypothetical protein
MLNKLILATMVACGISFSANAQEAEATFKPGAGVKTLETNIFGWGSSPNLKLRKFLTEAKAIRYETIVSYHTNNFPNNGGKSNSLNISYIPGIEKHFAGTSRLSPYIGLTLPLTLHLANFENETLKVNGATNSNASNRSYFNAGLDGLAGADLYVLKNFYVGFEVGAGLYYTKFAGGEVIYKDDSARNYEWEGSSSSGFFTFSKGGLRVGFTF